MRYHQSLVVGAFLLAAATTSAAAKSAGADGREPGSVLIYPIQATNQNSFVVLSVTNTNTNPVAGATNVLFEYVNITANGTPNEPCGCLVIDRVEALTPADTLSVLADCHNILGQEGYAVVTAQDPSLFKTAWSHNFLVGSELVVRPNGGVYSINAIPFASPVAQGLPTDLNGNTVVDFNDIEYEGVPDTIYIDSFIAAANSTLTLVSLTPGPVVSTQVRFDIFNDNEFPLSLVRSFPCWFQEPLIEVGLVFSEAFLANNTPNDPNELDINCDNLDDLETGWAIIRGISATLQSGEVVDPALVGAITAGPVGSINGGHLLWESELKQNGVFASCVPVIVTQPPLCQVTDPGPATIGVGETFVASYTVTDPDSATVTLLTSGPAGTIFAPPAGVLGVPFNGMITYTAQPADAGMTLNFSILVDDGEKQSSCPFSVNVLNEVDECPTEVTVMFDELVGPGGTVLPAGTPVSNQFLAMFGFTVTGTGPNAGPAIFDSSNPTALDPDLGTPNGVIDGGPGLVPGAPGVGFGPNAGAMNTLPLGNVLILQNNEIAEPNDDEDGGTLTLTFTQGVKIVSFKIVDADEGSLGEAHGFDAPVGGNLTFTKVINGIGDNSVQTDVINQADFTTRRLEIELIGSGALGELTFCLPDGGV